MYNSYVRYTDACFVVHSYGTFCALRICQLYSALVHSMAERASLSCSLGVPHASACHEVSMLP